ncbi:MAG: hypothetical protein JXB10_01440 [Pirellulales bacterium]|nr:hypothetical protein [Pirellulales bacterium]
MKLTADKAIEYLKRAPQNVAAWVAGISSRTFRDRHLPRNPDGTYNVREVIQSLIQSREDAELASGPSDSPWLERQRRAKALSMEQNLAQQTGLLISVELFLRVTEAAFIPLRRFAEEQIKEHGNGTADRWAEAVEEFTKEIKNVVKPTNPDREATFSGAGGTPDSVS